MEIINTSEWLSKPRYVCGIMTGTSVDAVDIAIASFSIYNGKHKFEIISTGCFEFSEQTRKFIFRIFSEYVPVSDISLLNFELANIFSDSVRKLCRKSRFPLKKIDALGVHGQTLYHGPNDKNIEYMEFSSTFQAVSVSALSKLLNKIVVGDFRAGDIAFGGQGAPLVPVFDYEFLRDTNENRIVLNIGGISNITILPADCKKEDVQAFDTGPGNVFIDMAVQKFFNLKFDKNGEIAKNGSVIPDMMNYLKSIPFIKKPAPKSTGRELFSRDYFEYFIDKYSLENTKKEDFVRTITEFTSWSIAENIRLFVKNPKRIIASGGGSDNTFLIDLLKKELPDIILDKSDNYGIPSDYKEALCFAYLAYLTLGGLSGNLPSVTGASNETILGVVALP